MMILHRCPQSLDGFQYVSCLEQLKEKVKIAMSQIRGYSQNFNSYLIYQVQHKRKCIMVSCTRKQCLWRLIYRSNQIKVRKMYFPDKEGGFYLCKFHLFHNHPPMKNLEHRSRFLKLRTLEQQERLNCQVLHDIGMNPNNITHYFSALTGIAPLKFRFSYYNYFCHKKVKDTLIFQAWYNSYNYQPKLSIITYPPINLKQKTLKLFGPDFVILTSQKIKNIYHSQGQIIGIKIIRNKILDKTEAYDDYHIVVFYQILPNATEIIYMVAFYPFKGTVFKNLRHKSKYMEETKKNSFYRSNSSKKTTHQSGTNKQERQVKNQTKVDWKKNIQRVDINLYKMMKLFLKIMGAKIQTFIIEDKQYVINTMQYLMQNVSPQQKFDYILNPCKFFQNNIPQFLQDDAKNLLSTYCYQEYYELYKKSIAKNRNSQQIEALRKLHQSRRRFLPFYRENNIFLGQWKQWMKQFSSPVLDDGLVFKRTLTYMLVLVSDGFIKQAQPEKDKLPSLKYRNVIQFTRINQFYQEQFLQHYRVTLYQSAFRHIMSELQRSYYISFIYNHNRKQMQKLKNQLHTVNLQIDNFQPLKYQQEQIDLNQKKMQLNKKEISERKQKIQSMNFKDQQYLSSHELASYENCILNSEEINRENQSCVGEQFKNYYDKIMSLYSDSYLQLSQKESIQNVCSDIVSEKEQQKEQKEQKKIVRPVLNYRYAKYDEIYPLQPPTTIKDFNKIPVYVQFWQNPRIVYCKKVNKDREIQENSQPKYVCSCNLTPIKGLPCRHILKICLKYKLKIDQYIEYYWKIGENYKEWRQYKFLSQGLEVPKLGRPKTSRRNKLIRY